jgi:hypothetical protein
MSDSTARDVLNDPDFYVQAAKLPPNRPPLLNPSDVPLRPCQRLGKAIPLNEIPLPHLWGTDKACPTLRRRPWDRPSMFDHWSWIRLGVDLQPRSLEELVPDVTNKAQRHVRYWTIHWTSFLKAMSISVRQASEEAYVVKLPGLSIPLPIHSMMDWYITMMTLFSQSQLNHETWCANPPPVVLICTSRQAQR